MKKGSVTVYMTWMLAVLLSLFVTVIEGARQRAISIQAETAVDLAVYSVFAEYNRALFDAYDLLFIDTSYGEKTGSLARAKKHFSYYANENLMQGQTAATADLTKCFLSDVSFPAYAYATDQKGAVFEKQAIRYMEQKYGLSYVAELKNGTGLDAAVRDYVFSFPQTQEFMAQLEKLLLFLLPQYNAEGKTVLVISVGCTGGHHRSVAVAHALAQKLTAAGFAVTESHRDISR